MLLCLKIVIVLNISLFQTHYFSLNREEILLQFVTSNEFFFCFQDGVRSATKVSVFCFIWHWFGNIGICLHMFAFHIFENIGMCLYVLNAAG